MRVLILLLLPVAAFAGNGPFFIPHGSEAPIVPGLAVRDASNPLNFYALDYDTSGLVVRCTSNATNTAFAYTCSSDCEDVTTTGTWENPGTGDLAIDAHMDGTFDLHFDTAPFAVADQTYLTCLVTDGGTLFADINFQIYMGFAVTDNDGRFAASVESVEAGAMAAELQPISDVTDKLDTALELDGAAYRFTENALEESPGNSLVEDLMGRALSGSRTFECVMLELEAVVAGYFTSDGDDRTFRSPDNGGVTVTGTQTSTTRSGVTVTCP